VNGIKVFFIEISDLNLIIVRFRLIHKFSNKNVKILSKAVMQYRKIQLLTLAFNKVNHMVVVSLLMGVASTQILLSVKLIKGGKNGMYYSKSTDNIWAKMYLFQVVFNSAVILNLVYGFCADVHFYSVKLIARMNQNAMGLKEHKIYRRTIKSLKVAKIDFWNNNYIEKITPMMYQDFAIMRIIDAILVT